MDHLEASMAVKPQEWVLEEMELQKHTGALRANVTPFKRITSLLFLSRKRRGEISHQEWDWVQDGTIKLSRTLTKNKQT